MVRNWMSFEISTLYRVKLSPIPYKITFNFKLDHKNKINTLLRKQGHTISWPLPDVPPYTTNFFILSISLTLTFIIKFPVIVSKIKKYKNKMNSKYHALIMYKTIKKIIVWNYKRK